ncbi:hypothetical protein [Nocardioides stalactiti]|uniref:hypothetical protein n=1 Tax=Nocardioides stalactiti TaxID=2755356 RepID=UPI0016042787|nr:hypothetical protein [Nocardioides stalactiti]
MFRLRTTPPSFLLARVFLALAGFSGVLAAVGALVRAATDDRLEREIRSRPRTPMIDDPSTWIALLDAAPAVLLGVVMMVVSWLLLVVVVDIQRGVPFDGRAVRRLRVSSALISVGIFAHALISAWADVEVLERVPRPRHGGNQDFSYYFLGEVLYAAPWLLVAAFLAVFAHAFTVGRSLADDQEGLV